MINPKNEADALSVLKKKKIVTIQQPSDQLECSRRTTQRRLKEWQTYNSHNKYGKYFTLPNIPKFDGYGLWKYKDVFFSRYGNLERGVSAKRKYPPYMVSSLDDQPIRQRRRGYGLLDERIEQHAS